MLTETRARDEVGILVAAENACGCLVELALQRETKDSLREASMDDRLIDGRGGTMPFSLERMDAWKRKPRSGKRPGSSAPAQARSRREA